MSKLQSTIGDKPPDNLNCPHCKALLPSWAGFCSSCGKQVEKGKNEERETYTANNDNDIRELEVDTVHIPFLSQEYAKRWQAFQSSKNTTITEQMHTGSSLDQKIEAPKQSLSSPLEVATKAELVDVQTQNDTPIPTGPSQFLPSVTATPVPETWQHMPKTDVSALLQLTTPLPIPTVSYIPQRNIVFRPPRLNWQWPTVIFLSAISAGLVNFVFTTSAIRPIVILWFLCICPGMVFVRSLRLKEPVVEWTLAFALSFSIDAIVAAIQLYTGRWSAAGTLSILMGFCLVITTTQLIRRISIIGITIYPVIKAIKGLFVAERNTKNTLLSFKWLDGVDTLLLLLPLVALLLWSISLQKVSLNDMNNLGLISALSPRIIAALGILVVSFALSLQRYKLRVPLLTFQLACIILILYTTPNLIEEMPRFAPIYRSAGYTDYIIQTGTVNPQLDFYFNIPGFYVLSAFFTKVFGYSTILSYAEWAPLFYNLIYAGPMYMIFTSITTNKRLIWLGLLFFYLTNWVGQDYFSPQGLNFFLYLVIIMILLKWFRMPSKQQVQLRQNSSLIQQVFMWLKTPDPRSPLIEPWQQRGLLYCLILIFGLVVFSHPLTPFFTLLSVFLLIALRRCRPFWLPILMLAMTAFWDFAVAGPYIFQHYNLLASLGHLLSNVPQSITSGKLSGDPLYHVISIMRLYMTVLLWLLALLGGIKRLRQGNKDITLILLAIAGFPMIAGQSYGGEMLARIYLFTELFMCFFAASLFFDNSVVVAHRSARSHTTFSWKTATIIVANLFLLSSFFFTRYGDERVDYVSYGEWNAVQRLYQIAPANALILASWNYCPLYFKDYTKYKIQFLDNAYAEAVINTNANGIIDLIENEVSRPSYIIFSQEEQVYATSYNGLPGDTLQRLETRLLQTGKFKLLYRNSDAQILQFVGNIGGSF